MVNYECPRCLYATDRKSSMRNHINKKSLCNVHNLDINIKNYENAILNIEDIAEIVRKENLANEVEKLKSQLEEANKIQLAEFDY